VKNGASSDRPPPFDFVEEWGTDSMETDYPGRVRPPPFDFVEEWGTHLKNARVPHPCSTRVGDRFEEGPSARYESVPHPSPGAKNGAPTRHKSVPHPSTSSKNGAPI
jgi:hypothetical protein